MASWIPWRGLAGMIGGGLIMAATLVSFMDPGDSPTSDAATVVSLLVAVVAFLFLLGALWALYTAPPAGTRPPAVRLVLYLVIGIFLAGVSGLIAIGLIGIGSRAASTRVGQGMIGLGILGFILAIPIAFWNAVLSSASGWIAAGSLLYGLGWIVLGWVLWRLDHPQPA